MRNGAKNRKEAVAPWSYNPAAWSQRIPICLLAVAGTLISAYLALYQMRLIETVWDPFFGDGTARVLDSGVSHTMKSWLRIPDAALGAIAYLGDAVFGLAGSTSRWKTRPWLVVLFGLDVIPLGIVSIILVILQGTVVGYWCFLCLVTAVISLILIILAWDEVWSCGVFLIRVWRRTRNTKIFWQTFWGKPCDDARAVGQDMVGES